MEMNKLYKELYEGEEWEVPKRYVFKWYPLSKEYSALYNYPDDIKLDWKLLLEECRKMLIEDGVEI